MRTKQKNVVRAFIAVQMPDDVRAALGQVNQVLAAQVPPRSVRWVKPELVHLTLRFLGDTAVTKLPTIATELDRIAARCTPFTLYLDELGCFPNRRRPRVIWVGLRGDDSALQELKKAVDICLEPLGWEREKRPFRSHLTLGRIKDSRKLRGIEWGAEVERMAVPVTAVHLIESQLRSTGPIYAVRHTSRLGR